MRGYTYHRVFPTEYEDQPIHWFLYDGAALSQKAHNREVPLFMVEKVQNDLHSRNYLFHAYENFARYRPHEPQAHMELSLADPGHGNEVAALYHVGSAPQPSPRSLYVQRTSVDNGPKGIRIPILHPLYEPLQYPLLFPEGTRGWGSDMRAQKWTQRKYYKYRLLTESRFQDFSRLGCEYICDMFSRMEDERLDFIRRGKAVEAARLRDLEGFEDDDDDDDNSLEENDCTTLPASFTGSPQYFANRTADALALSRQCGKPDFMITATCNPTWPELLEQLQPGQSAMEAPHITVRVFKESIMSLRICHCVPIIIIFTGTSPQTHQGNQRSVWRRLPRLCHRIPEARTTACTYCCEGLSMLCTHMGIH